MRRSRLFNTIRESINNETLQQPFNVRMVNESCNQLLERSTSFLCKHIIGKALIGSQTGLGVVANKLRIKKFI